MKNGKKKKNRKSGSAIGRLRPQSRDELFLLGLAHHKAGRFGYAASLYRQAMAISPDDVELLFNLGIVCHSLDDLEGALRHYSEALKYDPGNLLILRKKGAALQELGNLQEAAQAYGDVVALAREDIEAHHCLGIILYELWQLDQAAGFFEKCLRLNDSHPHAAYNLGLVRYGQGRLEEAVSCFNRNLEIDPENGNALYNLGTILRQLGRNEAAGRHLRAALKANPLDVDVLFNLGIVSKDLGELDEAIQFFKLALKIDPQNGVILRGLGLIHHLRNEIDQAIEAYGRAFATADSLEADNHMLSALMGRMAHSVPRQYVENLFDGYALNFEKSLTAMKYEIPARLKQALLNLPGIPGHFEKALDLGCGTGLSGMQFRPIVGWLAGVDLSAKMLEKAAAKEVYDTLSQGDLVEFLNNVEERFALYLLTDVIIYFGNLTPLFDALNKCTAAGDRVLFSTEFCNMKEEYMLRQSGRFAHSSDYINRLADRFSFHVEFCESAGIREEKGEWTMGEMYILSRI
ncbi:MAG: tetratricopeptide repeat protein [Proteobacteria bacterium]|nr:tetratricopeptide repeat protein [Pseudomonadota bacterium]MBU1710134.1 tetratricopeptide repeat protein [Pseudomonadota bacterium]